MFITEQVTCLVLHCARCNKVFKDDYESEQTIHWTAASLAQTFPSDMTSDAMGWRRIGDRVLCGDCWAFGDDEDGSPVEAGPLPVAEADRVVREQAAYASAAECAA